MRRIPGLSSLLLFCTSLLFPQTSPTTGLRDNTPAVHAFTNARIIVAPGKVIANGTLVVRDGVIEAVGEKIAVPADARVHDASAMTLYPGLIDLASAYGMPQPPAATGAPGGGAPRPPSAETQTPSGPGSWNVKTFAHVSGAEEFRPDDKTAETLRSQGFVLVLTRPVNGILRGSGALVTLGSGPARDLVLRSNVTQNIALSQTGSFTGGYPNSLMGTIAHVRQTFYDTDWYRRANDAYAKNPKLKRPETNDDLAALADAAQGRQPVIIEASDELNLLRAAKIGKEFKLNLWVDGSGREFRRLDAVRSAGLPVIVPLNFPEAPTVQTPEEAMNVSLEELMEWDIAPENAGRLVNAGVTVALTSEQLKDASTFLAQVRKAIARGLSADAALAALTTTPAKLTGMENRYGTLEAGRSASFLVTDGDLFAEKTHLRTVWIDGKPYNAKPAPEADVRGTWTMTTSAVPGQTDTLTAKGEPEKPTIEAVVHGKKLTGGSVTYTGGRIAFTLPGDSIGMPGTILLSGAVTEGEINGSGQQGDGTNFTWHAARRTPPAVEPDTTKPKKVEMASFPNDYPLGEYGRTMYPDQPVNVLFTNATVWTEGPQGRLANADILVTKGKIAAIGKGLKAPSGAVTIDATEKHLSPGIIDSHSHTAVSGSVNEAGQAITCEVRIADVIDPDDIWIYRQLAGGTTAANVLHGSANPIGGQNALVKWRWGSLPDDYIIDGAPQGVKFALGENVKQTHFLRDGRPSDRYPHTRMGVPELIRDRFKAALEYERSWKEWDKARTGIPPHKDLELDALLEIVKGTRLIHAHSYREDEVLALIRVTQDFGIRIATLQHILEGYKIADIIAKGDIGAGGFSDWWAYKWEAYDAIPGNIPLMAKQGVLVSYNSDDSQLATRLNWEAAKGVKFGMSEEDALAAVTINSAKQFGIDKMTGSLEVGKDADIAVWSGNPLLTGTKCLQTWVDGRRLFDVDEDRMMQKQAAEQRAALIQKILKEKAPAPGPTAGPSRFRRPNEVILQTCSGEDDHE